MTPLDQYSCMQSYMMLDTDTQCRRAGAISGPLANAAKFQPNSVSIVSREDLFGCLFNVSTVARTLSSD